MKKILLILFALTLAFSSAGRDKGINYSKLNALISDYRGTEGFEIVRIGVLGTSLIKPVAKIALRNETDDSEDLLVLTRMINGLRKLAVVEYEDCDAFIKVEFGVRLEQILLDDYLIMEAKDDGDLVKIYGVVDGKGEELRNFVVYIPSDCTLVCIYGTIPVAELMNLVS